MAFIGCKWLVVFRPRPGNAGGWRPANGEERVIDLHGRVALVTGGSRGIGAATCQLLARAGCDVAVHYTARRGPAQQVAQGIAALGRRASVLQADLRDATAAAALPQRVAAALGQLDVVVNNAGVWLHHPFEQMSMDAWRNTLSINLDAVYLITRASVGLLRASSHAVVVNVVSTAAQRGEAEYSDYAASKAAVIGLTKSLAVELAPHVRVNCVAPGWVETDMTAPALANPDRRRAIETEIPRRRVASVDDIAGPIVFLASDLAAHITGEVLNVNGGSVRCG